MKNANREIIFLRTLAVSLAVLMFLLSPTLYFGFKTENKFKTIDVERINIIEKDGTTKMIITNVEQFPNGTDSINGRPTNSKRKKRSGMLFFNEEGIENGGFIYDGSKNEKGHRAGMSLTFDQYDGDQVMQILTQDYKKDGKRWVSSALSFNDRPVNESQLDTERIMNELNAIADKNERKQKYQEYIDAGKLGGAPRLKIGSTPGGSNGMFLMDDKGKMRATFMIDQNNDVKLQIFDENGEVTATWPEK